MKINTWLAACLIFMGPSCELGNAALLHGSVEETDGVTRLARPGTTGNGTDNTQNGSLGMQRPMAAPDFRTGAPLSGLVDTQAFSSPPLRGNATNNNSGLGLLRPQYGSIPNSKFDLGAERGDRELTLAWEAWHHQLSAAIYKRWSEIASIPGMSTIRLTITRDRQITPQIIKSCGSPAFDRVLLDAIMSLNGNPGLTFPARSQRQQVTMEADYIASTDVQPGYTWVKNDYEHVHDRY